MPIYEYGCRDCRKKSSILVRSYSAPDHPACAHCGGVKTVKLVSTFAVLRTDEALMKQYDDMAWMADVDPDDSQSLDQVREWSQTHGVEHAGPYSPDNAYQNDVGDVNISGGIDEALHNKLHGLNGGE